MNNWFLNTILYLIFLLYLLEQKFKYWIAEKIILYFYIFMEYIMFCLNVWNDLYWYMKLGK